MGGPPTETLKTLRKVLVVVRNLTTLNRLVDVLPAISSDSRLSVKFVIDRGSGFARNLARYLDKLDVEELPWQVAQRSRWDLIIAAHVNAGLHRLRGPIVVLAHGAGFSRIVPDSTGDRHAPAGLARKQLTAGHRVIPAAIGISHDSQRDQLRSVCPEAVDRAFPAGDPTFDRILANLLRREHYRKLLKVGSRRLVVVSSTWGRHSSLAEQRELAMRLVAQLPIDEWLVALVLHPNVWFGHSGWEVKNVLFADALASGVLLIPPDCGWQAVLIAGDNIAGDHGSVSFYGAALGRPFVLSATGLAELAQDSARVVLSRTAKRLDVDGDLLAQIEASIARHDPDTITAITDQTLGWRHESLRLLRSKFYDLLGLPHPQSPPRIRPLPDPEPIHGPELTAQLMSATVRGASESSGTVELRRFPAVASEHRGPKPPLDLPEIVDDTELDANHRQNAEIVVHGPAVSEQAAERWLMNVVKEFEFAALFGVCAGARCLLRWRDGRLFEAVVTPILGVDPAKPNPLVAAAATYAWMSEGRPIPPAGVTLLVHMGAAGSVLRVRQLGYSVDPV